MIQEIDCRKQTCPLPVVNTKKALEKTTDEKLVVMVDNIVSRDNVRRFVQSQGHKVEIEDKEAAGYIICTSRVTPRRARNPPGLPG